MSTTTDVDLRPFLVGNTDRCRVYQFPNGYIASVHIGGTKNNILWDVWCEALGGDEYVRGLTSVQVRETLIGIHNLADN
jgi:hypothetical protein